MKRISIYFFILVILSGGLLVYQWIGYSSTPGVKVNTILQTIKIKHTQNKFQVEQTITGMKEDSYTIKIPDDVSNLTCVNMNEAECNINKSNLLILEDEKVTFQYDLPVNENVKSFLLQDYSIKLQDVVIDSTRVQLSDSTWRNGNWVSNSETSSMRKMDLVDYYVMENKGNEPFLYWQEETLQKMEEDKKLIIYSNTKHQLFKNKEQLPVNGKVIHLVLTNLHEEVENDNLLILNSNRKPLEIEEKYTMALIRSAYNISSNEEELTNLILAIVLKKPIGDGKYKKMYEELVERLSDEQLTKLREKVLYFHKRKMTHNLLDTLLEEVTGYRTSFFSDNAQNNEKVAPLTLLDSRELFIKDSQVSNVKIIHENGKMMIEFVPLLKALQYEVNIDNEKIKADKRAIKYQFYPNKRIFELNQQRYGMNYAPIINIEGQAFIHLKLIETLLNVHVSEHETKIEIN
ncbi:stalk domain-containing protein [Lederbergia citri]|uniref:Copper amine oxidase-like N-terminal domain-containing protein n=1 Tax=Lederbergia citri TaxID=2833580 RepID=A0A942TCC7_9BACI|nr:stalk domain-containing protein [Lederbergia citri]MBS4193872.1 hypothetical protein [Lederbergia citri]